jgi:hypothetical protein
LRAWGIFHCRCRGDLRSPVRGITGSAPGPATPMSRFLNQAFEIVQVPIDSIRDGAAEARAQL